METDLYYNPKTGLSISQNSIKLEGNNPNFYAYVFDSNVKVDPLGLMTETNTVDFTGHADLFLTTGSQKNIVTIQLNGRRSSDFTQAYKEAVDISKKQEWYTTCKKYI